MIIKEEEVTYVTFANIFSFTLKDELKTHIFERVQLPLALVTWCDCGWIVVVTRLLLTALFVGDLKFTTRVCFFMSFSQKCFSQYVKQK